MNNFRGKVGKELVDEHCLGPSAVYSFLSSLVQRRSSLEHGSRLMARITGSSWHQNSVMDHNVRQGTRAMATDSGQQDAADAGHAEAQAVGRVLRQCQGVPITVTG